MDGFHAWILDNHVQMADKFNAIFLGRAIMDLSDIGMLKLGDGDSFSLPDRPNFEGDNNQRKPPGNNDFGNDGRPPPPTGGGDGTNRGENGRGLMEVLEHRILFSLSKEDFDARIDRALEN